MERVLYATREGIRTLLTLLSAMEPKNEAMGASLCFASVHA